MPDHTIEVTIPEEAIAKAVSSRVQQVLVSWGGVGGEVTDAISSFVREYIRSDAFRDLVLSELRNTIQHEGKLLAGRQIKRHGAKAVAGLFEAGDDTTERNAT